MFTVPGFPTIFVVTGASGTFIGLVFRPSSSSLEPRERSSGWFSLRPHWSPGNVHRGWFSDHLRPHETRECSPWLVFRPTLFSLEAPGAVQNRNGLIIVLPPSAAGKRRPDGGGFVSLHHMVNRAHHVPSSWKGRASHRERVPIARGVLKHDAPRSTPCDSLFHLISP